MFLVIAVTRIYQRNNNIKSVCGDTGGRGDGEEDKRCPLQFIILARIPEPKFLYYW